MKKIPLRTCAQTKEKLEKRDLLRIVKDKEGKVFVDPTLKANGRGCYLKKDETVIKKARQSKVLERHLEITVPDSIYEELINIIK